MTVIVTTHAQLVMVNVIFWLAVIGLVWLVWFLFWLLAKLATWLNDEGDTTVDELAAEREALRVKWEALEQARQVNAVYFAASQELHQVAPVESAKRRR